MGELGPSEMRARIRAMPELTVVVPVYNEEQLVGDAVETLARTLDGAHIDYQLRVYDDGSRDGTASVLRELAVRNERIVVITKPNSGHGPTIARGYREATGEWIFQMDSDGEMPADQILTLWNRRSEFDFLIGRRISRQATTVRRLFTAVCRLMVRILFGGRIHDVNSPFRLMRKAWLLKALPWIPETAAAPNVMLSALASRSDARIFEMDVPYQQRRVGTGSLTSFRLWKLASIALLQTLATAFHRNR